MRRSDYFSFAALLVVCIALIAQGAFSQVATHDSNSLPPLTVVRSGKDAVTFSYTFGEKSKRESYFFAVPPDCEISLVIVDGSFDIIDRSSKSAGKETGVSFKTFNTDPKYKKYIARARAPRFVSVSVIGFIRFNRVAKVTIKPIHKNLVVKPNQLTISLKFSKPYKKRKLSDRALKNDVTGFGKIIRDIVVNPQDVEKYASTEPPPFDSAYNGGEWNEYRPEDQNAKWVKLKIDSEGLYRINVEMLMECGLDVTTFNPNGMGLFLKGEEIPTHVIGGFSGGFTVQDAIIFFAAEPSNQFSKYDVYWLRIPDEEGATSPKRIPTVDNLAQLTTVKNVVTSSTLTRRFEQDEQLLRTGDLLSENRPVWVWQELSAESPFETSFDLPFLIPNSHKAQIDLHLSLPSSKSVVGKRIAIGINDAEKEQFVIDSAEGLTKCISVDSALLRAKKNKLTITTERLEKETTEQEQQEPGLSLDYFNVSYPQFFSAHEGKLEFSLPPGCEDKFTRTAFWGFKNAIPVLFELTPDNAIVSHAFKRVTSSEITTVLKSHKDSRYIITAVDKITAPQLTQIDTPSNLRSPKNGADYVVIAYRDFIPLLSPLIELRKSQGFKPIVIDVDDIYDEFNYGVQSPLAIKNFLCYALMHWKKYKPEYVLFVGDATSDYLGDYRNGIVNYVPTYTLAGKRMIDDSWASDYWFSLVSGEDNFCDFSIGRVSLNNVEDVETAINKIIHYETESPLGPWRASFGYVADDEGFDKDCEILKYDYTPQYFINRNVYQKDYPYQDNFLIPKKIADEKKSKISLATTAHIRKLFNNGVALLNFYGHGSPNIWSTERVWFGGDSKNSDNLKLDNLDQMPFIVTMTCSTGHIDFPTLPWNTCISEDMMRVKKGGSVAMLVPSGPYFTSKHRKMSSALGESLFKHGFRRFGDIVSFAKIKYLSEESNTDLADMLIFLGDPASTFLLPDDLGPLDASSRHVIAGERTSVTVKGRVDSFSRGDVYIVVENPDDVVEKTDRLRLKRHRFEYMVIFPEDAKEGTWKIRAYVQNDRKHLDAAGGINVSVSSPIAQIKSFRIAQSGKKKMTVNESLNLIGSISNPSEIPLPDMNVEIVDSVNGRETVIINTTLSLQPGDSTEIEASVQLSKPGMHMFTLRLLNYNTDRKGDHPFEFEKSVAILILSDSHQIDAAISQEVSFMSKKDTTLQDKISLLVDVYNVGSEEIDDLEVGLIGRDGQVDAESLTSFKNLRSGKKRRAVIKTGLTMDQFNNSMAIVVDPHGKISDENLANNRVEIGSQSLRYIDLHLTPEDISFRNPAPTEGDTVFIDVTVSNRGSVDSREVKVEGFIGYPKDKNRLLNIADNTSSVVIGVISAGESETVTVRWDPFMNQGENDIYFKVSAKGDVTEIDKVNDVSHKILRVKSKAKFKAVGITHSQTAQDKEQDRLQFIATVKNIGETNAYDVALLFYRSTDQTDENKVGEAFLESLDAGETKEVVFVWQITAKDLEDPTPVRPSFKVGLKASSQLVSTVEE